MVVRPMTVKGACEFVSRVHRHHRRPPGGLFAARVVDGDVTRAVAIAARPVARMHQDGETAEITRLASDGAANACSRLYGALCRALEAIGYRRAITYTLASENGASLRAANFTEIGPAGGGSWDRPGRRRVDKHPTEPKVLWERRFRA